MSQRTSLTFWCFILGLVSLHGHSAHRGHATQTQTTSRKHLYTLRESTYLSNVKSLNISLHAVVEIRLARQSWSTWGRLAYGFEGQVKCLPIVFMFVLYLKAYMFPTAAKPTEAKGMKNLSTVQSQHVTKDIFDILMLHSRLGATSWPQRSSEAHFWTGASEDYLVSLHDESENIRSRWALALVGSTVIQVIEWKQAVFHVPNSRNEGSCCSHDRCRKLPPDYTMLLPPNRHPAKAPVFPETPPPFGDFGALWNGQDFQTRKLSCRVSTCCLWKELQNCLRLVDGPYELDVAIFEPCKSSLEGCQGHAAPNIFPVLAVEVSPKSDTLETQHKL